nr:hypothetical protein [Corallococcus interemptor]
MDRTSTVRSEDRPDSDSRAAFWLRDTLPADARLGRASLRSRGFACTLRPSGRLSTAGNSKLSTSALSDTPSQRRGASARSPSSDASTGLPRTERSRSTWTGWAGSPMAAVVSAALSSSHTSPAKRRDGSATRVSRGLAWTVSEPTTADSSGRSRAVRVSLLTSRSPSTRVTPWSPARSSAVATT